MRIESIQRFSLGKACVRCFAHDTLLYLVLRDCDGYQVSVCVLVPLYNRCSIAVNILSSPLLTTFHHALLILLFFILLSVL